MRTRAITRRLAALGLVGVTAGWGAAPAAAGPVYHWRTEDGTYAFTDDEKAIPERYRDQVEERQLGGGLSSYERYTPASGTAEAEPARVEPAEPSPAGERDPGQVRLEYLRALNRDAARAVPAGQGTPATISVRAGGANSPVINVTPNDDHEPVVIETIRVRPKGAAVTRSNLVVRQGDRVLTIIKPQLAETNVTSDIIREEDLE